MSTNVSTKHIAFLFWVNLSKKSELDCVAKMMNYDAKSMTACVTSLSTRNLLFQDLVGCTEQNIHTLKHMFNNHHKVKVKCKAIPFQAWTGPGGSRRLRLPDFKTIGT